MFLVCGENKSVLRKPTKRTLKPNPQRPQSMIQSCHSPAERLHLYQWHHYSWSVFLFSLHDCCLSSSTLITRKVVVYLSPAVYRCQSLILVPPPNFSAPRPPAVLQIIYALTHNLFLHHLFPSLLKSSFQQQKLI